MSEPSTSITQDRVVILNNMISRYSLCKTAYNHKWIDSAKMFEYEELLRKDALQELMETGLDYFPASMMIEDQFMSINPNTGEVIL